MSAPTRRRPARRCGTRSPSPSRRWTRIGSLVGCAAAGASLGDTPCYVLGRRFGPAVQRRFFATSATHAIASHLVPASGVVFLW